MINLTNLFLKPATPVLTVSKSTAKHLGQLQQNNECSTIWKDHTMTKMLKVKLINKKYYRTGIVSIDIMAPKVGHPARWTRTR